MSLGITGNWWTGPATPPGAPISGAEFDYLAGSVAEAGVHNYAYEITTLTESSTFHFINYLYLASEVRAAQAENPGASIRALIDASLITPVDYLYTDLGLGGEWVPVDFIAALEVGENFLPVRTPNDLDPGEYLVAMEVRDPDTEELLSHAEGWAFLVRPPQLTLTLTDKEDGTGITAGISGYGEDTVNTLYVSIDGAAFTSKGSTWADDEMDVAMSNGIILAYAVSTAGGVSTASAPVRTSSTGGSPAAAMDNIPVAVRAMKQLAVYWPYITSDAYGKPVYGDVAEIACRWEDTQETFIDPSGSRKRSIAKLIVDRDLKVGGALVLGAMDSIADVDDPRNNEGFWHIRGIKKTPNFKGTKFLREVYL